MYTRVATRSVEWLTELLRQSTLIAQVSKVARLTRPRPPKSTDRAMGMAALL